MNNNSMLLNFLKTRTGVILISILWGLGLATLFRAVCKGKDCMIIKAPDAKAMEQTTFTTGDGKCYKFTPYVVKCK